MSFKVQFTETLLTCHRGYAATICALEDHHDGVTCVLSKLISHYPYVSCVNRKDSGELSSKLAIPRYSY